VFAALEQGGRNVEMGTIGANQITPEIRRNVHHVVWKVLGGSHRIDNLALLHPDCHRQVHSRPTTVVHRVLTHSAFEGLAPYAGNSQVRF